MSVVLQNFMRGDTVANIGSANWLPEVYGTRRYTDKVAGETMRVGDVVVLSASDETYVEKATSATDDRVLGVIVERDNKDIDDDILVDKAVKILGFGEHPYVRMEPSSGDQNTAVYLRVSRTTAGLVEPLGSGSASRWMCKLEGQYTDAVTANLVPVSLIR